jgi:LysM repeat protein
LAQREYRPYPTRKQSANRNLRRIMVGLIVAIVGGIILIKTYNQPQEAEPVNNNQVAINDILPHPQPARTETPKPRVTPTPDPTVSEVIAPSPGSIRLKPEQPAAPATNAPAVLPVPTAPVTSTPTPVMTGTPADLPANPMAADSGSVTGDVRAAIDRSVLLRDQGKIAASRDLLNSVLDEPMSTQVRAAVKAQLSKLAEAWLMSREVMADDTLCTYYVVQPGDRLALIAKRYKVPYELLMDINGIQRPELLQAGQRIKVVQGPFNAVVYKGSFTMDLYLQRTYVKTYRVGLGTIQHDTPTGRWRAQKGGKMIRPTWTDPDTGKTYVGTSPDYPLGSRWIALEGIDGAAKGRTGFAIHGTKEPETIGTRSSRGCIRLHNGDVIEVYDRMFEGVSEVLVKD